MENKRGKGLGTKIKNKIIKTKIKISTIK